MWFGHRIAGPSSGSRSKPFSSMSQSRRANGRERRAGRAAARRRHRFALTTASSYAPIVTAIAGADVNSR